jgi:hypothetical protein
MKILIVGDSISSLSPSLEKTVFQNGFIDPIDKSWASLIQHNNTTTNLSIGGKSNTSIFNDTCLELIQNKNLYDLVIIQWSSLLRLSVNKGDSIYANPQNFTVEAGVPEYEKFHSIWVKHFLHPRIALLEWMTQIIVLDNFLKQSQIPYMFIKGFDNFLKDLQHDHWSNTSDEFKSIVLHLNDLPDWEIDSFYSELKLLSDTMEMQTKGNWVNLTKLSWVDSMIDLADDNSHPGIMSHKKFFDSITNFAKSLGLDG